ncbi:MAG: lytic transglycosylase F [Deltaproteobacteria bacterium HGW-Deltaproteobacteria-10]|nr:MAG: lytic transglycosylase F [Deltaproteobacteria bacterium HGW-Deltaproteobacteria-10]
MERKKYFYWFGLGLAGVLIAVLIYLVTGKWDRKPLITEQQQPRTLALASKEWTGDFDKMLENRRVRVLVPHSRSLYFNDRGRERGMIGESMRDFEHYLNKKYSKKLGRRPLTVFIIPTTRDALLTAVAGGQGDIAAGDITVTEERLKTVDFAAPEGGPQVKELLITGPRSPAVRSLEDLAGKTVHVRKSTSYYNSLLSLNERFKKEGGFWSQKKAPVKIILVPDALEDEDMLEMLNAGLFEFIVVDDVMAKMWARVLPKIKVRDDIVLRQGGKIGWAIRKGSPLLEAEILDFYKNYLKKYGVIETRLVQYHRSMKQIKDPTGTAEWKRFEQTIALFEKYGQKYRFDPVMLAAQGYQESTLDQTKRSPVGAVGIMQIMPATGASLRVGDIRVTEPNIHGGTKYMDTLLTTYLPDRNFTEQDRTLFAFASYNAGPGNISRMRKLAKARGLDPDKWFNNVEVVTAEKIGLQTTSYVRNIYKYYIAYKLTLKALAEKSEARGQLPTVKNKPGEK